MRSLQIVPIFSRSSWGSVPELAPAGNGAYLIHHKAERVRRIGWFVVMDRAKASAADSARRAHGFQPGPVLSAQGSVGIPGVSHRGAFLSGRW